MVGSPSRDVLPTLPCSEIWRGFALLRSLPIAAVGMALDIPVFFVANQKLKRGNAIGYW